MSDIETFVGKLVSTGQTVEEFMSGFDIPEGRSLEDFFYEVNYKEYELVNGIVYKIDIDASGYSTSDLFYSHKNPDGTIGFVVQYYNGGCGFSEAIEKALERSDN